MPEKSRFYWQTRNPYISSKEKELLMPLLNVGLSGGRGEALTFV